MSKILGIDTNKLQNAEHFEFMDEFIRIIVLFITGAPLGQIARDIEALFNAFKQTFAIEDDAYKLILKSAITRQLSQLDGVRDSDWTNLIGNVNLLLKHFNTAIADAAYRVKIEFDGFGNIAQKGYNSETADIVNIIQSLRGKLAADVATLGLAEWVDRLEQSNLDFMAAFSERGDEQTDKNTLGRMRDARLATDGDYRAIVNRINAGIEYNGPQEYEAFVGRLNTHIKYYNDTIAQRRGRAAAKKEKEEAEANNNNNNNNNNTQTPPNDNNEGDNNYIPTDPPVRS